MEVASRNWGGRYSREQGDELRGLGEDGDILLRRLLGHSGPGLFLLWAVVWAYALCGSRGWLADLVTSLCRHRENLWMTSKYEWGLIFNAT